MGTAIEDFRSVRTNLQFVRANGPARVIVISSALASEGKSVTAANLAITLAQGGKSVCLIEGDLRNPKAMSYFGVDDSVGLTNVVYGQHHLDEVLVPWNHGQVTLLPAGPTPPDPGQLLGSTATSSLLAKLRDRFDVVLIDAPPLLPVSDAAVLGGSADGIILVVRHAHARREQVAMVYERLVAANVRLIGTIFTQVPAGVRRDGHEYGYPTTEQSWSSSEVSDNAI
jgi:receptor protein-tyrosine kinase